MAADDCGGWVLWEKDSDTSVFLMPLGARCSLPRPCVLPVGSARSVYTRAHFWKSEGAKLKTETIPPVWQMPESKALGDMLMENRDFLFTQLTIWMGKAMSKEIAVTKSSEAASLASFTSAPECFSCFLASYAVWMVGQGRVGARNCRQMQGRGEDKAAGAGERGSCKCLEQRG